MCPGGTARAGAKSLDTCCGPPTETIVTIQVSECKVSVVWHLNYLPYLSSCVTQDVLVGYNINVMCTGPCGSIQNKSPIAIVSRDARAEVHVLSRYLNGACWPADRTEVISPVVRTDT